MRHRSGRRHDSIPDYVDYVIATGKTHSIRDLLDITFHHVSISDWEPHVVQDSRFTRPADVDILVGDASKARAELGWSPRVDFKQLIETVVDTDLEIEKRSSSPVEN